MRLGPSMGVRIRCLRATKIARLFVRFRSDPSSLCVATFPPLVSPLSPRARHLGSFNS